MKTKEEYPFTELEKQAVHYVATDDLAMFADDDTRMIYEHYYIKGFEHAAGSIKGLISILESNPKLWLTESQQAILSHARELIKQHPL